VQSRFGRGICCLDGGSWGWEVDPWSWSKDSLAEVGFPEAGAKTVLPGPECSYLAGEVPDYLKKCSVVWGWASRTLRPLKIIHMRSLDYTGAELLFALLF
jgi:hypothetical protein